MTLPLTINETFEMVLIAVLLDADYPGSEGLALGSLPLLPPSVPLRRPLGVLNKFGQPVSVGGGVA